MSLLAGWLPVTVQVVAAGAVALAVGWRDRRWRLWWVPSLAVGATMAAFGAARVVNSSLDDPLPARVWVWVGALVFALGVLVAGWLRARPWRRAVSVLAVPLAALCVGTAVNQFVGYYPTVDTAFGDLTSAPPPNEVRPVDIPGSFPHREEYVYLPPVWFTSPASRPHLPALELIGGVLGKPLDWVRTGGAVTSADAYARQHHGWAPVLVFVDPSGSFSNDTECVNGPRGNAEDHLVRDVPAYVAQRFGISSEPAKWGVVGWSMGGTCAIDLAVEHPETFGHFLDISGDLGPNMGAKANTIRVLYGGNAAAWAAHDPRTVLRDAHLPNTTAIFAAGTAEARQLGVARRLDQACRAAGLRTTLIIQPGSHTWQFAARVFATALPQLMSDSDRSPLLHAWLPGAAR